MIAHRFYGYLSSQLALTTALQVLVLSGVVMAGPRAFTVTDSIQLRRLIDPPSRPSAELVTGSVPVPRLSPDGKHAAIIVRAGNSATGENEYELWVYSVERLRAFVNGSAMAVSPSPSIVARFSTQSHEHGIDQLTWCSNHNDLCFIGRRTDGIGQVYRVAIDGSRIIKLTSHSGDVGTYGILADGQALVFTAKEPPDWNERNRRGYVVRWDDGKWSRLKDLGIHDPKQTAQMHRYFAQPLSTNKAQRIELESHFPYRPSRPAISPSGRWAVVLIAPLRIPVHWREYESFQKALKIQKRALEWVNDRENLGSDRSLSAELSEALRPDVRIALQYWLIDLERLQATPLIDAPVQLGGRAIWSADSKSVTVSNVYLPLTKESQHEQWSRRTHLPDAVAVSIESGVAAPARMPRPSSGGVPIRLRIRQDLNIPPDLEVEDLSTGRSRLITDLNPLLRQVRFSQSAPFSWVDGLGRSFTGGLLLPPGYDRARRYPLVVQTHGFFPKEFLIDGEDETASAFAARALAARGIIVLQLDEVPTGQQGSEGFSNTQRELPLVRVAYESAIDALAARKMIERRRVGIVGFSRTGMYVHHMLAYSSYPIAAATVCDSVANTPLSYALYFANGSSMTEWEGAFHTGENEVAGIAPFWGAGIHLWMERSYIFHLDRIQTPVRYEEIGTKNVTSEHWDAFAIQKRMLRPVEMIHIPMDHHGLQTPWGRYRSQQGNVDWYDFWLNDFEDSDPAKASQYARWRLLRTQRDALIPQRTVRPADPSMH